MSELQYIREPSPLDNLIVDQCVLLNATHTKSLANFENTVPKKRRILIRSLDPYIACNSYYVYLEDTDAQERATNLFPFNHHSETSFVDLDENEFYPYSERGAQLAYLNQRPVSFLILGKPGIGQKDLGRMLAEYWRCVYIHPETLIEEEIASGSRTGQCIEFNLRCGRAIGIDIILRLVEKRIKSKTAQHRGFVICGFPLVANDLYQEDPVSSESAVFNVHEIFEDLFNITIEIGHPPEVKVHVSKTSHFLDAEEDVQGEEIPEEAAPDAEPVGEITTEVPREPVDVGSATGNICAPPDISLNYEEQINYLFSLLEHPFVTIYVACSNADVIDRRDSYRFNTAINRVICLQPNLSTNTLYTVYAKEPFNDWEIPEDFTEGFNESVEVDQRHLENLLKLPRDFTATVSAQLEHYRYGVLQPIERQVLSTDPGYYIKIDGRIPPTKMFNSVKMKLRTLPLQKVLIPEKFNLKEDVMGGEGDIPPMDINLEGMTPEEFFNQFRGKNVINKMFKYTMSDWGTTCPVSMKEGTYLQGDLNFAVHFMNKMFFLSDEEAYKKFVKNPRPYLVLPYPKPRNRIAIMGPKFSGKSSLAKCLAYLLDAEILCPEMLRRDFIREKRQQFIEKCRSHAITEIMAKMEKDFLEQQADMKEYNMKLITQLLENYVALKEKIKAHELKNEISSFPMMLKTENTELGVLQAQVQELQPEFFHFGLMDLFNKVELCEECLKDPELLMAYLPKKFRQVSLAYVPPDVFDPKILEYAENAARNLDMEDIELTSEDLLNVIKNGIKKAEDKNEARGNSKGGWVLDGFIPEYEFIKELGPDFVDDVFIMYDDSDNFDILVERLKNKETYQFNDFKELFLDLENLNAAFRVPTRSNESMKEYFAGAILNEIIDNLHDDDESIPGESAVDFIEKVDEVQAARYVKPSVIENFVRQIRKLNEHIQEVRPLFEESGVTLTVLDINKYSIKEILLQVIRIFQKRYSQVPSVVTPEDRLQELEDFGEPAAEDAGGEEAGEGEEKEIQEDTFFERRRFGDAFVYDPVTFYDSFVLWRGKEDLAVKFEDKLYFFSTEDNMNRFLDRPEDFLPKTKPPEVMPPPRICVVGVLGAGKTLIARALARNLGLYYVNFESLVINWLLKNQLIKRRYFSFQNIESADFQNYLTSGQALSDQILDCLLPLWFNNPKRKVGFVLDGFPRRPSDVEYMLRNSLIPDVIFELDVAVEISVERVRQAKIEAWHARVAQERKYRLKAFKAEIEHWENERKLKFDEMMEERRQLRYATKMDEQIPTIPEAEHEEDDLLKTAVSLKSIEEDTDAQEINRLLDEIMPEPELVQTIETEEEVSNRILENAGQYFDRDVTFLRTICELSESELIPWVILNANMPIDRVFSQAMRHADKIKFRGKAIFERCYDIPLDIAENLLAQGFYFLSPFGRNCPVQCIEGENPIQLYLPYAEQSRLFPMLYRQHVYFLAGKKNRDKFKKDPLKYTRQDEPIRPNLTPFKMAVIGPPCSGKTTLAKRLAKEFGFKYVSPGLSVRYVLDYIPNSNLAQQIDKVLKKGWELTPEMTMNCVEAACLDGRSNAQGCIFDGFPQQRHECYYLNAANLLPQVVIDLQASHEDVHAFQSGLKPGRYLPALSRNYVEHRYEEWSRTSQDFRKYLTSDYNNLYELSVHPSIWGCWTGGFNIACEVFKNIKKYNDEVFYDTALKLTNLLVCPLEFLERKSRFKGYCPMCLAESGSLNTNDFDHHGYVQYKSNFYWFCPIHMDKFEEDPDKFLISVREISLPDDLPEVLTLEDYELLRSGKCPNLNNEGYCVVCFKEKGALDGTIEGMYDYAIKYKNQIYLFDCAKCLQTFRASPFDYCNVVIERLDGLGLPLLSKNSLPVIGFLEQYEANIIVKAISNCANLRPIVAGLNEARSAAVCIGLYLKCFNPNTSERRLEYYKEARESMLKRHLTLTNFLAKFKDTLNPFIYYEEPLDDFKEPDWYQSAMDFPHKDEDAQSSFSMRGILDEVLNKMDFN